MKKICFITTIPLTIRVFVLKTAAYLHEHTDWDISMICDEDEEFRKELPDYIHYIPVKMKRGFSLSGIKAMREMKKIFEREKFDLIQYSTPNASLYASMAGKKAKVPVRLYCQWGMVYVGFHGIKRKIFKAVEKYVCKSSTWVEPDSYSNLRFAHAEKLYPEDKGSVIWNGSACGIDLQKFDVAKKEGYRKAIRAQYHLPDDAYVYGFVGRITRDKGINELFAAFKEIAQERDNAYLMMVGPTEMDETVDAELYEWTKSCGRVIYTGYTKVVEQYVSAMDAYLLPSYREGFGLGVVEAEAMGVPVIVSDIPGPVDAMEENVTGIIVKKGDVETLAAAMKELYEDRDKGLRFGLAGIAHAKERFEQKTLQAHILADRKRLMSIE